MIQLLVCKNLRTLKPSKGSYTWSLENILLCQELSEMVRGYTWYYTVV